MVVLFQAATKGFYDIIPGWLTRWTYGFRSKCFEPHLNLFLGGIDSHASSPDMPRVRVAIYRHMGRNDWSGAQYQTFALWQNV